MFAIFFCSSDALTKYYEDLMTHPNSPLKSFYPKGISSYYVTQNKVFRNYQIHRMALCVYKIILTHDA